jgi:nucleotide-binding universal stress UspA family protein
MIEIPRILCAVDFSDISRHALEHALTIARWYDSQLTALYVVPTDMGIPPRMLFDDLEPATGGERHALASNHLEAFLIDVDRGDVRVDAVVEHGDPARTILRHATGEEFDLLVLGTHGRSGFEHLVLGSVAERVLRKAKCPVLTVPPKAHSDATLPYRRLLCAVDFSDSSLDALRLAFSIAEESDAELTLLNVIDFPPDDALLFGRAEALEFRSRLQTETMGRLEALIGGDERMWCRPRARTAIGKPYRCIVAIASEERADLIVMGVRGRNPADLAVFGSTTNHVVRSAPCPVLTSRR